MERFAARGALILKTQPSWLPAGYGAKFRALNVRAILRTGDYADVISGVDYLIGKVHGG